MAVEPGKVLTREIDLGVGAEIDIAHAALSDRAVVPRAENQLLVSVRAQPQEVPDRLPTEEIVVAHHVLHRQADGLDFLGQVEALPEAVWPRMRENTRQPGHA